MFVMSNRYPVCRYIVMFLWIFRLFYRQCRELCLPPLHRLTCPAPCRGWPPTSRVSAVILGTMSLICTCVCSKLSPHWPLSMFHSVSSLFVPVRLVHGPLPPSPITRLSIISAVAEFPVTFYLIPFLQELLVVAATLRSTIYCFHPCIVTVCLTILIPMTLTQWPCQEISAHELIIFPAGNRNWIWSEILWYCGGKIGIPTAGKYIIFRHCWPP